MLKTERKIRSDSLLLILFLTLFAAPFFYFSVNLVIGVWGIKKIENDLQKGDFKDAKEKSFWVEKSFGRCHSVFVLGQPVFSFLDAEKTTKTENLFALIDVSSGGLVSALAAAEETEVVSSSFLKGERNDQNKSWQKIKTELGMAFEKISQAQSLIGQFSGKEVFVGKRILIFKKELPKLRLALLQGQEIVTFLPEFLGEDGRKTYLLLFQNNMELRPTGGFIGSFGLLTVEKGAFLDLEIQDVYFADGQLRGHVEPPVKLAEFLGQASWFLRDSNWDPDFPTSAARAEWFLEKETGRSVDGVIGLDLFVFQRLLEVFGEIELADYQEKINAQNFFEKAQFHNEVGFFPGSTAKGDFLGASATALFERLKTADKKQLVKTGLVFYRSFLTRDILLALHHEEAMRRLGKFGWDGALRQVQCKRGKSGCLEDYLMVVEANVGVNKANYFLARELQLQTKINQDGQVVKKLTITYQNNSPSEIFPGGKYKNYLRLYVPEGSILGEYQTGGGVEETLEHQRTVFGFLVEVPAGAKQKVEINWSLPGVLEGGQYYFLLQKQPGTRDDPLVLDFSFPKTWGVGLSSSDALTNKGTLFYNTLLAEDKVLSFEFKKSN